MAMTTKQASEKWGIAVTKSDVLQKFASDIFQKMEDGSDE